MPSPTQLTSTTAGHGSSHVEGNNTSGSGSTAEGASQGGLNEHDSDFDDDDIAGEPGSGEAIPLTKISKAAGERDYLSSSSDDEDSPREETAGARKHVRFQSGRRTSNSTVHSYMLYTPDEERRVIRKFDRKLVLFLAFLYMLSFLDRSNIGNARIAGLEQDLQLKPSQYEWLLTSFYITYVSFEWMTLLYRIVPAHIYISVCTVAWALVASFQSIVTSFGSLVVLRALLGLSEAAFSPGLPFYLSFFYKRDELALRTGLVISAAPLASSFAGSLAWLITRLGKHGPIAPWRLLFLVEGFPSVLVAVFVWLYVPDNPAQARYLTAGERKVATLRLRDEKDVKNVEANRKGIDWREVLGTLRDPFCYLTAMMFFSCNVAFSSLPVFLPTIIHDMGYSSLSSQALSAPPYLLAFFVVLLTALLSDRYRNRNNFIIGHALLASLGYTLIALAGAFNWGITWRYLGVYPAAIGFFSAVTIIITWTLNNQPSDSRKGAGLAFLNIVGQCGPLLGTRLYPDEDGPLYVRGMAICAGFMLFVALLAVIMRGVLKRRNRNIGVTSEEDKERLMGSGRSAGRDSDARSSNPAEDSKHRKDEFIFML